MPTQFTSPISFRHEDQSVERQSRNLDERIKELVARPAINGTVLLDVELASGVATLIPHGAGQPVSVFVSAVRGASTSGQVDETRPAANDRSKYVTLTAKGYGATITVDLWVL